MNVLVSTEFEKGIFYFSGPSVQFDDHIEMIKYAFNSINASGRLEDGLNLVHSQKRMVAFDYQFATVEGKYIYLSLIVMNESHKS